MAFPTTPLTVTVELALGADLTAAPGTWAWTDISTSVRETPGVVITRGRQDATSRTESASMQLTLDNRSGNFTPQNPSGAYYGSLRRNTPIRVRVNPGAGTVTRFTGYVSAWPPRWDISGRNRYATITAAGLLRRLEKRSRPIQSALRRAIPESSPQAYWPVEDSAGSLRAASVPGSHVSPMFIDGTVRFGSVSDLAGSDSLPDLDGGGRLRGEVPAYAVGANPALTVDFWFKSSSAASTTHYPLEFAATASLNRFEVEVTSTALNVLVYDNLGAEQTSGGFSYTADLTDDNWHNVKIIAATGAAASVDLSLYVDGTLRDSFNTGAPQFVGRVTGVTANPRSLAGGPLVSVGHIAVFNGSVTTNFYTVGLGNVGETAGTRIQRLCSENSVPYVASGSESDSERMGAQPIASLVDVLRECAEADGGMLVETLTGELTYLPRVLFYNPAVQLDLDYAQGHIAPPFEPTDDDMFLVNDVTAQRVGGSSAQYADDTSVAADGRYDEQVTLNIEGDGRLLSHASWRVWLGKVDDLRYPRISLNFARSPSLITAWQTTDVGDRVTISNPPTGLPPDDVDQLIQGYAEVIRSKEWGVVFNCSPTKPWQVGVYDTARYDTSGSQLNGSHNSTTTSLSVEVFAGPLWTTTDVPFDIRCGGERMTVTAVSGASSPQTFTVTRSVNGVAKSHADNTALSLWQPAVYAL